MSRDTSSGGEPPGPQPSAIFSMLHRTFGDAGMEAIWSETATVDGWLRTEAALSLSQGAVGDLDPAWADAIASACTLESIDVPGLWAGMANVGYPILGLVRQIAARLPEGPDRAVHYGATTQDIMDTGLALQLAAALDRLDAMVDALGDAFAAQAERHAATVMAGRTHGQQAVPTTLGAKLAIFLPPGAAAAGGPPGGAGRGMRREPLRCSRVVRGVRTTSVLGPGGDGPAAGAGRRDGPRHAARDGIAAYGAVCARAAALCTRLAREVIDLSRTEIGEIGEASGHHRGASSTMPQKANPIDSESTLGAAVTAASMAGTLYRAMEVSQERAAGEWQIEWHVVPQLSCLTATALAISTRIVTGLAVHPERMLANLAAEQGRTMAEAYMFELAPALGRERAHDVVYEAAVRSKTDGLELRTALLGVAGLREDELRTLAPGDYLGDSLAQTSAAIAAWRAAREGDR